MIDQHGRLFGRVNLIDALVAVIVLGLIPLAYGAFALFRVPSPTVTAVTPTRVAANQPIVLLISGTNLRTYMKVFLGNVPANVTFDEAGRVRASLVAMLPAGTYDLVLADEAQQLVSVPHAVTVVAPPTAIAVVKVRFMAPPEVLAHMTAGDHDVGDDGNLAVLTEIGPERQPVTAVIQDNVLGRLVQTSQPMVGFNGTVRVPVMVTASGATYRGRPVKPGAAFLFESASGAMTGAIQDVQTAPVPPAAE
jgi:hypothetical protein